MVVRYSSGAPASLLPVRRCTNCATRMIARPSTPLGGAFAPRVPRGVTSMLMPPAPISGRVRPDGVWPQARLGAVIRSSEATPTPGSLPYEVLGDCAATVDALVERRPNWVSCASRAPAHDAGVTGQRGSVGQSRGRDGPVGAVRSPCAEHSLQPVLAGHARALKAGKREAGEAVLGDLAVTSHGDAPVLEREVEGPGIADDREIDEEALKPCAVAVDPDAERPTVGRRTAIDVGTAKRPAHFARFAAIKDGAVRVAGRPGYVERAGRLGLGHVPL